MQLKEYFSLLFRNLLGVPAFFVPCLQYYTLIGPKIISEIPNTGDHVNHRQGVRRGQYMVWMFHSVTTVRTATTLAKKNTGVTKLPSELNAECRNSPGGTRPVRARREQSQDDNPQCGIWGALHNSGSVLACCFGTGQWWYHAQIRLMTVR